MNDMLWFAFGIGAGCVISAGVWLYIRLGRVPPWQREPPHCPTCGCGLHPSGDGLKKY